MRSFGLLTCLSLVSLVAVTGHPTITSNTFQFLNHPENARELYEKFKRDYKKQPLNSADEERRFGIFKENLVRAQIYQTMEQGTAQYGITQFSDLTPDEFADLYTKTKFPADPVKSDDNVNYNVHAMPSSVDWREKGAVTPVADQGECGSCWAFSAIGNIEGQWFLHSGNLYNLSKQQLVDCDTMDDGCEGGVPWSAFESLISQGGVEAEESYPYTGLQGECHADPKRFVAYVNLSHLLGPNERAQAAWLAGNGPLSSALNAKPLQFYIRGIFQPPPALCPPSGVNHAVLTVGYGSESGTPFWIVKNSWGTAWGEDGYFRIRRGNGTCGINKYVCTSIVL